MSSKRPYVGFGNLKDIERQVRERDEANPSDISPPRDTKPSDVAPPGGTAPPDPVVAPPGDISPPGGEMSLGLDIGQVEGFLRLPNTVVDLVLPRLTTAEQAVYLRLFRLSHGYRRETCRVSYETLGKAVNMNRRTVIRTLERLELMRLVARVERVGGKDTGGNTFRVWSPEPSGEMSPRGSTPPGGKSSPGGRVSPMKEGRKDRGEKKAPPAVSVSNPEQDRTHWRYCAARLTEQHGGRRGGYTLDRLRADMLVVWGAQGVEPDEALIEWTLQPYVEALGGK